MRSLDVAAGEVLEQYRHIGEAARLEALGNRGGFSGARLWHVHCPDGDLCLRAWPERQRGRLAIIHGLMAAARSLSFVPGVVAVAGATTWVCLEDRLWELTHWMPGAADFHACPSTTRLRNACAALARLHVVWQGPSPDLAPCPAVERRLQACREWQDLLAGGWRPTWATHPAGDLDGLAPRALSLVLAHVGRIQTLLEPWRRRPVPTQFCLCDVWHDHVLFTGDAVTGIVDYGEVKGDHVAVDLARLLGSLIGDDPAGWDAGLKAYREVRPLSAEEEGLARVLDVTGTVLGAANWLRRVYHEHRPYEDWRAVARRLATLVERLQGCDIR